MTNSLRLALVLSLAACSPSPLGLLTLPDAATEADATPPLPRDVRFAWSATDASPVADAAAPDAAPADDGEVPDAGVMPDAALPPADGAALPPDAVADAVVPSPDAAEVPDVADDAGTADAPVREDAADAGAMPDAAAVDAAAPSPDVPVVPVCQGETSACQGGCRDLRNDPQHCGACGTSCRTGDECRAGQCWGWVFRGAYSLDTRPYAREREIARLSAALNAECAMRAPGARLCSNAEARLAADEACDTQRFEWVTRDRVEWLESNEAAASLLICRDGAVLPSAGTLLTATHNLACCVFAIR